jgi:hypothetical protein
VFSCIQLCNFCENGSRSRALHLVTLCLRRSLKMEVATRSNLDRLSLVTACLPWSRGLRSPSIIHLTIPCDSSIPSRYISCLFILSTMSFFKSDSNCCSSRKPPSPDSFPPRLAVSKGLIPPQVPQDARVSWTASEAAEIRAIFEEGDKDTEAEIIQVKRNSTDKLKAILLGDDSNSDTNSEMLNAKKNNSRTLSFVTQKLKQHLSLESGLNKRHSKSSVGTSEEEVERRAELRRIRQKRIQEELSNEELYDDDAKSWTSIPDATSSKCRLSCRSSWTPGEVPSLPSLTPPSLDYLTLSSPVLPPLEE